MTLEFKPNLQVTTETLRPSANRSISVPTTAMADCSSKASSSLLIISTLTVFSSIIANSLINVKRKLQKINFSIGTASSAPMELCSTKPTSSATGGSTLTVQRSDHDDDVDYNDKADIYVMMMILHRRYCRHKQY